MGKLLWIVALTVVVALFMLALPAPVIRGSASGTETPAAPITLGMDQSVTGTVQADQPVVYTFALSHDHDIVVEIKSNGPLSITYCNNFQLTTASNGDGSCSDGGPFGPIKADGKTPLIQFLLETKKEYASYVLIISMDSTTDKPTASPTAGPTASAVSYTLTTYQLVPKALNSAGSANDTFSSATPYRVYQTTGQVKDWPFARVQTKSPDGPYLWAVAQSPRGGDSAFRLANGFGPWALMLTPDEENKTYHILVGGTGALSLIISNVSVQDLPTKDFQVALNKDKPAAIYRWPTSGNKQSLEASFNVSPPTSYASIAVETSQGGGGFTVGGEGEGPNILGLDVPVDHEVFWILQLGPDTESVLIRVNYRKAAAHAQPEQPTAAATKSP